ncbi:hypothetical protein KXV47_008217 [Aspergillus fumigatus]|nr:hypothetical protein KXV47_008217 [Aspergillus fumigatus]
MARPLVDSMNGVKGSELHHGVPTAIFPSSTLYGATWNNTLMEELGRALAYQAKLKSAQVILGPTINIHRDPRGGRNFECFSEDPLLSGQLAAGVVRGIQSQGVAACPKHFACNESEFKRREYSVAQSHNSRAVREIYLAAFQEMLRRSEPHGLMVSYNKLNGTHTTEHPFLKEILRDEWAYNGCLVSDCFATKSCAASINAGLDLEMPGPSVFRGPKLVAAVRDGVVDEKAVDECVSRVLALAEKTRESHSLELERSEIIPETNALALKIASEGIVLLKNEQGVLPLDMRRALKIAVIGVPASEPVVSGGGSARLTVRGQKMTEEAGDSDLKISVRVKNTGIYPGHEVVQLYISPPDSTKVWRPARELKGYAKVWILPGESETVTISLHKKHAFSYWDEDAKQWRLEPGTYRLLVGPFSTPFEIPHSLVWSGR